MGQDMVFISSYKFIRNSLYKYVSYYLLQNNYKSLLMGMLAVFFIDRAVSQARYYTALSNPYAKQRVAMQEWPCHYFDLP